LNSGGSPARVAESRIACPSASAETPICAFARVKASSSGSVSTPPKSVMTAAGRAVISGRRRSP
jgi:hypothetical protein